MLISIFLLLTLAFVEGRGPHHPTVSHHHYHPQPSEKKLLSDTELLHDKRHIVEELGEWADDTHSPLTDEEIEFRYFKVHDLDNNTKLDGLEIYQAIKHSLDSSSNHDSNFWAEKELMIVKLIDQVLLEDDQDNDGYLTYAEYTAGRAKDRKQSKQ